MAVLYGKLDFFPVQRSTTHILNPINIAANRNWQLVKRKARKPPGLSISAVRWEVGNEKD